MANQRHKIDSYKVFIYGSDRVGLEWRWGTKVLALYSDDVHVATAYFTTAGAKPGEDALAGNTIFFNAPEEQYAHVMDLLRNEYPVFINWVPKADAKEPNDGDAYFETQREKAGEGDIGAEPRVPVRPGMVQKINVKPR